MDTSHSAPEETPVAHAAGVFPARADSARPADAPWHNAPWHIGRAVALAWTGSAVVLLAILVLLILNTQN